MKPFILQLGVIINSGKKSAGQGLISAFAGRRLTARGGRRQVPTD